MRSVRSYREQRPSRELEAPTIEPQTPRSATVPLAAKSINVFDLGRTLLGRQLRLIAKRTVLGVVLPIIIPVMMFALYTFVFHSIFKVGISRYPVYLFAGLLPWTYLSQNLTGATMALSREAELVRRVRIPYALLPMASSGAGLIYLLVTLAGFIIVLAGTGHAYPMLIPALVLPVLALYLFVTGLALLLSVIDVFNRDLRALLSNIIQVWFFIVPVAYSQAAIAKHLGPLVRDDPVSFIVGEFREFLYYGHFGGPGRTIAMMAICGGFFVVALLVFVRATRDVAKNV